MKEFVCRQLDDYLGGELLQPERSLFERHLQHCPSCSDEVAAFVCLKRRLASAADRESCPSDLIRWVESQILTAPERKPVRATARIAVAAAALCVAAWLTLGIRHAQPPDRPPGRSGIARTAAGDRAKPSDPPAPELNESAAHVRVELPDDYLAVPVESDDPRVTIIWVYPTMDISAPIDSPDPSSPRREL